MTVKKVTDRLLRVCLCLCEGLMRERMDDGLKEKESGIQRRRVPLYMPVG